MPTMTAVALVARTLRRRLAASMLAVAVVAGAAGGIATGLVAGAARSRTAPERAISAAHVLDIMISDPTVTPEQVDEIRALPAVKGVSRLTGLGLVLQGHDYITMTANVDGRWGRDVDVARIVRGRAADPDSAHEVVLGETVAKSLGVDVGDVLRFDSWSPEQIAAWTEREPTEEEQATFLGPTVDVQVVGIGRHPADLTSDNPLNFFTALPPGFLRAYQGRVGQWFPLLAIDIGAAPSAAKVADVSADVLKIGGDDANLEDAGEQQGGPLVDTLGFVATAMLALSAAVGLAGVVLAGLLLGRTVSTAAEDTVSLTPLGMTRRERARAIATALAPAVAGAAVLTFVVALASSAFLPFGLARRADPDPGLHLDGVLFPIGVAATALVVAAIIVASAARAARQATAGHHVARPGLVSRLARTGLPVGALCGVDLATARVRGRSANRAAAVGVGLATVAGVGALVLVASVDHVFTTPAAYGWIWDFTTSEDTAAGLVEDPAVQSVGVVTSTPVSFEGQAIITRGISSLKGQQPVLVVHGRPPGPGEVVLGARTMANLGVHIGDTLTARGSRAERELRIAGEAVFAGVIDVPEAGWGAAVQLSDLEALGPGGDATTRGVVALTDGVDRAAFAAKIAAISGEAPEVAEAPVELQRLREIESFPWMLTGFLVAAGVVVVGHAVVVTIRRRGGDLAVLRSIGLGRRGVYQAISTHAAVVAIAGTLVGVPLGIAAGQALWRGLASSLGVVVIVEVPWPAIVTAALTACLVLAALSLVPARAAARARPAALLRAE
jgi:putative ABC transport system permease protein